MNTFLFFRNGNQMLIFFLFSQRVQILKTVQIRPILYSSQPIRLQIFFRDSDNNIDSNNNHNKGFNNRKNGIKIKGGNNDNNNNNNNNNNSNRY